MSPTRVAWIDQARGVALAAMIVFHFCFDLRMFNYVGWTFGEGGWFWFAAAIAASFVALAGTSLQLAHGRGIRWKGFLRREVVLIAAAAAVTIATHFAMGSAVWFGILHAIALFSLLALPFVIAPTWLVAVAAMLTFVAPRFLTSDLFAHPLLYPLGLSTTPRYSLDYEPLFPWFAATLVGLILARVAPLPRTEPAADLMARMGRHSLVIYLLHQPVLIGMFSAYRWLTSL